MRLVLDTNALLAAVVADGLCRDLVRKRIKPHHLITSPALLDELATKLREKFEREPADVPLFAAYRDRAEHVSPQPLPASVCRDPDDDIVLATAAAGDADVIVTGDADLLSLRSYQGIPILSPRQFLELLHQEG